MMRKFLMGLAGAAAVLACASTGWADNSLMKRGTVSWVDPATGTVGMTDGTRFRAAQGVDVSGLTTGRPVVLHYHQIRGGNLVVSYAYDDPVRIIQGQPTTVVTQPPAPPLSVASQPADSVVIIHEASPTVISPYPAPTVIAPSPSGLVVAPDPGQVVIITEPPPLDPRYQTNTLP